MVNIIINYALNYHIVDPNYRSTVQNFLKDPRPESCIDCEQILFTNMRNNSFKQKLAGFISQNQHPIIFVTVGRDHVDEIVSMLNSGSVNRSGICPSVCQVDSEQIDPNDVKLTIKQLMDQAQQRVNRPT